MKISELIQSQNFELFNPQLEDDKKIEGVVVGDLLSHIIAKGNPGEIWITIHGHKNVIAVAALNEFSAIILPDGAKPDLSMLEAAIEHKIPVLGSDKSAFTISGELFQLFLNN